MLRFSSLLRTKGFPILNIVVALWLLLPGTVYAASVQGQGSWLRQAGTSALQEIGAIAGHVTKAADGTPIADALVVAHNSSERYVSVKTDAKGAYGLTGLPADTYQVTATAAGHDALTQKGVQVTVNSTTTVDFALQASQPVNQGGSLTGHLRAASSGDAIGGATVLLMQGSSVLRGATSDANGRYAFNSVAAGTYSAVAFATGYQPATQDNVAVSANNTTTVNFALHATAAQPLATGSLIGQVVNAANGEPVAEAVALLRQRAPLPTLSAWTEETVVQTATDAKGKYSFTDLEPGIYRLRVKAEGFHKVTIDGIAILAGQTAVVNVALRPRAEQLPRGVITGRVTDAATGEAVQDALVFFTPSHGQDKDGHNRRSVRTKDDGAYVLENLPAVTYEIHVNARGYKPAKVKDVTVKAGEQTIADVTLEAVPGRGRKHDDGDDDHGKKAKVKRAGEEIALFKGALLPRFLAEVPL